MDARASDDVYISMLVLMPSDSVWESVQRYGCAFILCVCVHVRKYGGVFQCLMPADSTHLLCTNMRVLLFCRHVCCEGV